MTDAQGGQGRTITFQFHAWTGWDWWRNLLPVKRQARTVARRLLEGSYKGWDFQKARLVVAVHGQSFQVLDGGGRVEPCPPEELPRLPA